MMTVLIDERSADMSIGMYATDDIGRDSDFFPKPKRL